MEAFAAKGNGPLLFAHHASLNIHSFISPCVAYRETCLIYVFLYLAEFGRYRAQSARRVRDGGSRPIADKFPLRVISNNPLPPVEESGDETGKSKRNCAR
jgi:hypothetical protein